MQQFMRQNDGLVKPLQVGIKAAPPRVAVGLLFDDARLFGELLRVIFGRVGMIGMVAVKLKSAPMLNGGS